MVPQRFGGYQTSIRTYIEVMAEVGRGCGSTAWVASLINVCAWLAGLFPERAQQDVWGADRDAWVAGSLAPNGVAVPVDGGWRVSGRWPWASGCMHAQWVACGIHMKNERGEMANLGLSLHADRRGDGRGHLVHGRHEGHRQQHDRRERRVRARAPLPAVPARVRRAVSDGNTRRGGLSRRAGAGHGADSGRLAARRGARGARPRIVAADDARHHAHQLPHAGGVGRISDARRRSGDEDRHGVPARVSRRRRSRSRTRRTGA